MKNTDKQRDILLQQLVNIEEDLDALGVRDEKGDWMVRPDEGDGTKADPIDNADITEDFEEKVARLDVLERQYTQIKQAIDAIDAGTYGICEVCDGKIAEKRLAAYPAATTCIDHAN